MPVLTANELLTLQFYARHTEVYLEWGSGASTLLVAPLAQSAFSIENHQPWCQKMLHNLSSVGFWTLNSVLTYKCVDTGPTKEWGRPVEGVTLMQMKAYVDAIDSLGISFADVVLIDGR